MAPDALGAEIAEGAGVACPYCRELFKPRRKWQEFCSDTCRTAYDRDIGTLGIVKSVRRNAHGVSVVIQFEEGPAAERALGLRPKHAARVVRREREGQ